MHAGRKHSPRQGTEEQRQLWTGKTILLNELGERLYITAQDSHFPVVEAPPEVLRPDYGM